MMQSFRSFRRMAIIVIAIIIVVPLVAIGIFVASFNPNRYKPQIIAAVERATHRTLTIQGPLRVSLSLVPTISASGIALSNPPGYADANFVTLHKVKAQIALLPLLNHRLNILKLVLVDPSIDLEYGPTGRPNWLFNEGGTGGGAGHAAPTSQKPEPRTAERTIALQSVSVEQGTITYKPTGSLAPLTPGLAPQGPAAPVILKIVHFTGSADAIDAPLHLHMQAQYDGEPFNLDGTTGPVSRLTGGGNSSSRWPVDVTLSAKGSDLHVNGTVAHPRHAAGYALDLHAAVPDLAALSPYLGTILGGVALPPLRSVQAHAQIADRQAAGGLPSISNVSLTAGASDLGTWRKGLSIASLNASMASFEQPLHLAMTGSYQGKPLALEGNAGPFAPIIKAAFGTQAPAPAGKPAAKAGTMLPGERFTVNFAAKVGKAQFGVAGGIATPSKLSGVALKLTATIPDLANLSDLVGTSLPAWTNIGLSGLLTDPGGQGLQHAIGLNSLAVSADQAQFGGAFRLMFGATPDLQAVINAPRVDLTTLLKAMPKPQAAPAGANTVSRTTTTPAAPSAGNAVSAGRSVIPGTPLPFNLLRRGNGNVELTIDQMMYDGATYNAITAHGLLHDGVLTVRPISAELPGGSVSGTLSVDATANPPRVHVTESAPAFRLAPLLTMLGLPNAAGATVQLYGDLTGEGNTPRGIAATLNGSLGLASVNGEIDGTLLDKLFGSALGAAGLPASLVGQQGPVNLRCFAGRLDAKNGLASVRALTLDSSRLDLTGTGTIDLGSERLNLILRPQVRIGGGSAPIPVSVRGTFADPHTAIARRGAYDATVSALAQQLGKHNSGTVLGRFARQLGIVPKQPGPQTCTGALELARMGHPGPAPSGTSTAGSPAPQPGTRASGPQNLLQSLFH